MLAGCVGDDFKAQFTADLARFGIDYEVYPSDMTGGFGLVYDARGDRTLDVLGIANPVPQFPVAVAKADFVLLGPILGEISLGLAQKIRAATSAPILLDPQGFLRRIPGENRVEHYRNPEIDTVIPLCDIVKANEHEARLITGIDPYESEDAPERAVKRLHEMGCKIAIVTLAADGSIIYDGQELIRVPAYATNAVDPTGAGDTYAGGFMTRYSEGDGSLREVGFFASCVASVMVENTGPDFPLTRAEADRRTRVLLDKFSKG